ncbi:MAG: DNA polymerase III subunit delta [Hyphomicrobiaceae bacterium]|nr:DNA polymerase III subunit delta [Hyphomicrobiaceae bacterium]
MGAVKSHQADAFLRSADPKICAILLYGPDAGLVSERAQQAAAAWAKRETPPGEIIRIEDEDLDGEPDRLSVELMTLPMFGGRKVVRTATGRRINTNLLKALLAEGPLPSTLIVETGNLKGSDALRTLFEKPAFAVALACYGDEERDVASVIDKDLRAARMSIAPDAREALVARLGADRVLTRSEIEKLITYCHGRKRIETADVEAIVGDASELTIDRVVAATASGATAVASIELARALDSGESAQMIILALQRHFIRLHLIAAEVEAGRTVADAIKAIKPPVHFKVKDQLTAQARSWRAGRLTDALSLISTAAKAARRTSALEDVLAERLVLSLAHLAR